MNGDLAGASTEAFTHLFAAYARLFDRFPEELDLLRKVTVEKLQAARRPETLDGYEHVAEHFKAVFPAVMGDARVRGFTDKFVAAYGSMPTTPETRLQIGPDDHSIGFAVVVGGAIGVGVAAIIVGYCLGGPDPAPGESVEVRC